MSKEAKDYLARVNGLIEQAYRERGIETNITADQITISFNVRRTLKSPQDQELVNLLASIHHHDVGT